MSMLPHVVHLTSVHYPFDTRIFHKECKSLVAAGYDVTLIAPAAEGSMIHDGVRLRAVPVPKSRPERMTHTIWQVYKAAIDENAEIYHFHDPELMGIGALLKMHGKRVIYDVHEDYSGSMSGKSWLPVTFHRPASILMSIGEGTFTKAYDRVIAATPTIARKFHPAKTRVVQNFPWNNELRVSNSTPYAERDPIAVYVGWLSDTRGMREMADAAKLVAQQTQIKLVTAGKVRAGAKANLGFGDDREIVENRGMLNRSEVAELLAAARVGLVTLHPTKNYLNAQPTKMFEYMSVGLPVIASDFPVWRAIVDQAKCGLLVNPLSPADIAEALLWLLSHPKEAEEMGRNGQLAVAEQYNWERESDRLLATYAELHANRGCS